MPAKRIFASMDFIERGLRGGWASRATGHGKRGDAARFRDGFVSLPHEPLPPIRVLIADDSAAMRNELTRMLDSSPHIRVCGTARDGQEVVEKTKQLQPHVITLSVEMPLLSGVEALKRIMR